MKHDIGPPRTTSGQRVAMWIAGILGIWAAWHACHDSYYGDFDFPDDVDLAISRVEYAARDLVGSAEDAVEETNENMQNTVDGRNRFNDRHIKRDVQ